MTKFRSWAIEQPAPSKLKDAGERPRVLKISVKSMPVMNAGTQAQFEALARRPRKGKRYPTMMEAPDL
ncbi:hypothetical protein [Pseudoxanthomonas sp.]|jgi:hypothetical protein|uniref:hypothetical protein n=1 Tax=Pseudoxanthomonas sp. TaxID=1871049 RepID=UPI002FE33CD3